MATWNLDTAHSEVQFKVRHMMVSNVSGYFRSFSGTLAAEADDLSDAQFDFEAQIDSIDTRNSDRDGHLKSPDFFDAENHPTLSFKSTGIKTDGEDWLIKGDITIRGNTLPIELKGEYNGQAVDPYGQIKAGFEITGKIKRKEFGLTWDAVTEAGSIVVSDDVKLSINAQFIKG